MRQRFHWQPYLSDWVDKAQIVLIVLALLIVMFATNRPIKRIFAIERLKRLIAGFRASKLLRALSGQNEWHSDIRGEIR
jgi:hypothetical protein